MNLKKSQDDIIRVISAINFIFLIISFFSYGRLLFNILVITNIILLTTHLIISKYFNVFQGILIANSFAKKLNNKLGEIHGEVPGEV